MVYCSEVLGTKTMEFEWVRGVRMSPRTADLIKKTCEEHEFSPTAHAPYYVNFNSPEKKTLDASIYRIADTLEMAEKLGVKSVAVHAGFNHGKTSLDVTPNIEKAIERLNGMLKASTKENVKLAVETMGKPSQFGSLAECIALAKKFDNVSICLDIAHMQARSRGEINSYEDFVDIFRRIKKELGAEALENLHMHISGIEFGPAGERKHLMLEDGKLKWREFLKAVADENVGGWLVCESPDQETDTKLLLAEWKKIK